MMTNKLLIMTKGLPGAGKSTWSRNYLHKYGKTVIVNYDDLRFIMLDTPYSRNKSAFIYGVRDSIIALGLMDGNTVIVDGTNLNAFHEERLSELAKEYKVGFQIKDFTNVPLKVCLRQNKQRKYAVPANMIIEMHKEFGLGKAS